MHASAIRFALRHKFRLGRRGENGYYYLANAKGERIDCPAWGETTAAGAIRMMRRHLRTNRMEARAV